MTSAAPSAIAREEHKRQGTAQPAEVNDARLMLRIAPAQIGDNEFAVDATDPRPDAQAAPTKVLLRFTMIGHAMGIVQTEAQSTDTQHYSVRGSFASMGGRWQIEVILRRAGFEDVRHTFEVDIVRAAQAP